MEARELPALRDVTMAGLRQTRELRFENRSARRAEF
jgi:hypothetical protein